MPISADDRRRLKDTIRAAIKEHMNSEGMYEDEVLLPETRAAVVLTGNPPNSDRTRALLEVRHEAN